jgi:hypothetical protein
MHIPGTAAAGEDALRSAHRLFRSPGSLLLSLLLLSAIFRPYGGLIHDACLYALQCVHRTTPGLHADDLFLKYGSQDNYSAFSLLAGPLVQCVGVPAAFFLLYLGGSACWIFAVQRLLPALQGRSLAALGAMIYVVVNPLPFGGYQIFQVNETFLTPRLWAVALVLLGLERLLRGRQASSLAWIALSMVLHPIMGFSGLCIWVLHQLPSRLRPRTLLLGAAFVAAGIVGVLAYQPLGTALFGHMDDEWRACVTRANSYSVPSAWLLTDWLAIANAFAIVAAGRTFLSWKPSARRMLDAIMLLAAVGLAIGLVAPWLPYKLLIQGQAYRAVWLLQFVQLPVLFALVGGLAKRRLSSIGQMAAIVVLCSFALATMTVPQIAAGVLLAAGAYGWSLAAHELDPSRSRVLRWGSVAALLVSAGISAASYAAAYPILLDWLAPLARVAAVPLVVGPLVAFGTAACLLLAMNARLRAGAVFTTAAVGGWLGIQSVFFLVPTSSLYESLGVEQAGNAALVEAYLANQPAEGEGTPVLYWPIGPLDSVWLELGCNSFYSIPQTAGNMFNRGTAIEGRRRAMLAAQFELDVRQDWLRSDADGLGRQIHRNFGHSDAEPTVSDLIRLCAEEDIDLVILPRRFDGWHAATNGELYIYDARRIRESLQAGAWPALTSSAGGSSQ